MLASKGSNTAGETLAPKKVRRDRRREVVLPIRVFGTGLGDRNFVEDCVCLKVSRHGAQIRLKHSVVAGDVVRIVNLLTQKEGTYRVISRVRKPAGTPYADWGVEAVEPVEGVWDR